MPPPSVCATNSKYRGGEADSFVFDGLLSFFDCNLTANLLQPQTKIRIRKKNGNKDSKYRLKDFQTVFRIFGLVCTYSGGLLVFAQGTNRVKKTLKSRKDVDFGVFLHPEKLRQLFHETAPECAVFCLKLTRLGNF
ncbi:hypothetical protein [Neisseria meningitidis]|uniref:hypothetical protein n=1 Tax=Neisseria meningitidis TaxID=487 RepID=UPI0018648D7F|nr:hypothetical protein [Neisseria meningitidis]